MPKGILLDMGLPGIDGWTVMARLKENLKTKHIPVHILSGQDQKRDGLKMGAVGFFVKPVSMDAVGIAFDRLDRVISTPVKHLLVVEDNESQQKAIGELIGNSDVIITQAFTGEQALEQLKHQKFDCIILDIGLPDMTGLTLLTRIRQMDDAVHMPVIVYTGQSLTGEEKAEFDRYCEKLIIKDSDTYESLFAQTTLFLHRIAGNLPREKLALLKLTHDKESIFKDKRVLIVDDDMRNVFALSSTLEKKGMQVLAAENGREGVACIRENPDIDLILMDIMMPEMDGYEAMKKIRSFPGFQQVPIIALTAKAMKGDRSQCIKAGASDYLSKPVNTDKLLSMMRVWLY
jgi:CheY-like chemotaxis protein